MNRNNEVERMWKEVIELNLRYYASVYLEGLRNESQNRLSGAKICTQNL